MRTIDKKPKMPKRNKNPKRKKFKKKVKKEIKEESVALLSDLGKSDNQITRMLNLPRDKEYLLALRERMSMDELQPIRDKRREKIIENMGTIINMALKRLKKKLKSKKVKPGELVYVIDKLGRNYVELLKNTTRREHERSGLVFPLPLSKDEFSGAKEVLDIKALPGDGSRKGNGEK